MIRFTAEVSFAVGVAWLARGLWLARGVMRKIDEACQGTTHE